ncbi:MAG: NUDIX domain-containing protein [Candidatus Saccharimonas sp.]
MKEIDENPSKDEQQVFHELGLEVDSLGRPLHPWHDELPQLGEGKGFYWEWGPNYTVDPIVISRGSEPKILLVKRRDNSKWALPGGFVDHGEVAYEAGIREVEEETHLVLDPLDTFYCYSGPVLDERSRLHAWSDTTAILWHSEMAESVYGGDDAEQAQWFNLRDVKTLGDLHGSHGTLIDMAIREHGTLNEQLEYFGDDNECVEPKGGHMGYTRLVASLPNGSRIFVKRHDAHRFTDGTRAEHSKKYLRKEHHVYTQLRDVSPHIPAHVELQGDHTLLLDAYDPRDGWRWKAPTDIEERRHYIEDVLDALRSLEPLHYEAFGGIKTSYQTIIDEGWGDYLEYKKAINDKLLNSGIVGSRELAEVLDTLYAEYLSLDPPELLYFAHYDIRQSNIAWHPEEGVRIVDWSWADHAPSGMDTTSFLVDIAKAGHDIGNYMQHAERDHLLLLIGFWLGHSVWPTPTADQTVREHQIGSAVAAHKLLKGLSK